MPRPSGSLWWLLLLAAGVIALALWLAITGAETGDRGADRNRVGLDGRSDALVFAHRGASGYRPEHTLAGYRLAIEQGADAIEPDLVMTEDGKLVARHENDITRTTDVAQHPEFADRRTTKTIDGVRLTGWFTEDFTLDELRTLRVVERLPDVRPDNTRFDGRFRIPTFAEVLRLARDASRETGRRITVLPEIKHPSYFDSIGLSPEEPVLRTLRRSGLDRADAPVVIQSFEVGNLRELDAVTDIPLMQLVTEVGGPVDRPGSRYVDMVTAAGLQHIAAYADWVAPGKSMVLAGPPEQGRVTGLVADAHAAGLDVAVWTLRTEDGDVAAEADALLDAGADALFTDEPDLVLAARD